MKSRKILSMLLAMLMLATMVPMSFAADGAEDPASSSAVVEDISAEGDAAPAEGDAAPAEGDAAPAEGDAAPAENDAAPAEGDAAPAENDAAPAEGDAAPAENDAAPAEGDAAPAEGDAAPAEGDTQVTVPIVVKKEAKLSASSVLVNGKAVAFDAYTIDGYNYFKLRDIAAAVTGTDAAFNVSWNADAFCIELTTGASYEKAEGDLVAGVGEAAVTASSTQMAILLDGASVELSGYSIGGNTYFQLRDLGEKLGFTVAWNAEAKAIVIDTAKVAPADAPAETPADASADEAEKPADASADAAEKPADAPADAAEKPADASADDAETPAEGDTEAAADTSAKE